MSITNEYAATRLLADHQAELLAEAANERLAREARGGSARRTWWQGLQDLVGRGTHPSRPQAGWHPQSAARC